MMLEKNITKNDFDRNNYIQNGMLINEIKQIESKTPMETLEWNSKKVKIMKGIKPNIILNYNKKKKAIRKQS
jgi:hypothetical protein